jgi:hypothetical protein
VFQYLIDALEPIGGKNMKNKVKMIVVIIFIAVAVTFGYVKGLFDGRAERDLSIFATAQAEGIKGVAVKIAGPDQKGNFELVDVPGWKRMELSKMVGFKKFSSVNIHAAYVERSPGHWCLVDRRYIWCP